MVSIRLVVEACSGKVDVTFAGIRKDGSKFVMVSICLVVKACSGEVDVSFAGIR